MDTLRGIFGRGLPGVARVMPGKGFALGEVTTAQLAQIPCDVRRRGEERRVPGGSGTADQKVICEKDDADAYDWHGITPAFTQSEADGRYARTASINNFTAKQKIDRTIAANAWLAIGSGSGGLTDKSIMGIKIELDSTTLSGSLAGEHINLVVVDGTPTSDIHGLVSHIEIEDDDPAATGDTVALWGDVDVDAHSGRNVWGLNTFVSVSDPDYTGALIGAEIGANNGATAVNVGGALHLVAGGTQDVRFGCKISCAHMQHAIMVESGSSAPTTNLIYYGPLAAGSVPTGTPLFVVDTTGALSWGNDVIFSRPSSGQLRLVGAQTIRSTADPALALERYAADATPVRIRLRKSRNATEGSHTVVNSGDSLGLIAFQGSDGSNYQNAAAIEAKVDTTPGASDMPGSLIFSTTPDGSASLVNRVLIGNDGGLALQDGITAPATRSGWATLYVDTADGDLKVKFGDGTVKTIVTDT